MPWRTDPGKASRRWHIAYEIEVIKHDVKALTSCGRPFLRDAEIIGHFETNESERSSRARYDSPGDRWFSASQSAKMAVLSTSATVSGGGDCRV